MEGWTCIYSSVSSFVRSWTTGADDPHRLFGYVAVVRGFDLTCKADENCASFRVALYNLEPRFDHPFPLGRAGIQQMHVDSLPHGRNQPFYHVTCSDGMKLYVASEKIGRAHV